MNEHGVNELRTRGGIWADSIQDALDFIKGCEDEDGSFDAVITDANNNPVRIYYGGIWFTVAQEPEAERERDRQSSRAKALEIDLLAVISSAKSYLNGVNSMISPVSLRNLLDEVERKLFEQEPPTETDEGGAA